MAQIALSIAGSYFGPIGSFIGSKVGAYIDREVFGIGDKSVEGPRLGDLSVQASTYGKAIPRLFGPECPVTGNIIWSSGLKESPHKQGKGGPQVTNYTYSVDLAILLADRRHQTPIVGVAEVLANGKKIYDSGLLSSGGVVGANPIGEIFNGSTFDPMIFFQLANQTHAVYDSITIYPGDGGQLPDPTIEAKMGVGEVPGYRYSAYAVIKNLQLADYGNRPPNLQFLVVADLSTTTGDIALLICELSGIDITRHISTTFLTDEVRGYSIGSNSDGVSALQPLSLAFNFDVCDVGGDMRFVPRDWPPDAVIPANDLGAFAYGEKAADDPILWKRDAETQLPKEAAVTFCDPEMQYQNNTATARRAAGYAQNNLVTQLPLTADADLGQRVADRMLWEAWNRRHTATARVDDTWHFLESGKKYAFETPAGLEPLRITRRTRGENGVIDLALARDRTEIYHSANTGAHGAPPDNDVSLPGETELVLLDIPIMRDLDDDAGFYMAVSGPSTGWRGSDVLRALALAGEYDEVAPMGIRSAIGDITGTVPDGVAPGDATSAHAFDDVTVIRVTLHDPRLTLESVDDEAIFAGANAFFMGNPDDTTYGEIAQYGVADLISPGVYDLSHLYRGRQGTEFATSLHGPGEIFVKLDKEALKRANFGAGDLNLERVYKGVSLLVSPDDTDAQYFTNTGVGLRPWSPHLLAMSGFTGGDLSLSWERRSRLETGALGEASELYTVRIMSADGLTILREEQTSIPSFLYTRPMQDEDFVSPPASLRWRVAQVSATYGNGIFAEQIDAGDVGSSGEYGAEGIIEEINL